MSQASLFTDTYTVEALERMRRAIVEIVRVVDLNDDCGQVRPGSSIRGEIRKKVQEMDCEQFIEADTTV